MRAFSLLCFVALWSFSWAQPFAIGRQTVTLTDPARSNRTIASEMFYPALTAGNNTTMASGTFPVIVFGHGFSMNYDAYSNFWEELVPQGYILAFPKTEVGPIPFPSHGDFAADMNYTITWFLAESNAPASRYYQKLNGKFAVMGHSMGGGCSFLAAANNPNITVMANFAAAETNPSAIAAAASITIPSLILAGSKDCVAGPSGNQTPMYNALASACKAYVNITDASHCQFAESNTLCSFGETTSCFGASYISRSAQHAKTFEYLNPFLAFYLKGDCNAFTQYQQLLANPNGAAVQSQCSYQLPMATVATTLTTCPGDTDGVAIATVTGGAIPYQYNWSNPNASGDTAFGLGKGTYILTLTDNLGCTVIDTFEIQEPVFWSPLIVSLMGTQLCEGDTARVVPIDNYYGYLWNTGDTTQTLFVTQSGFYNCTVTQGDGCLVAGVGLTVNFYQDYLNPEIALAGDSLYVTEGTVTAWFNNGTAVPNATGNYILNPEPGGYYAQVVDSNGCSYIAKAYTVMPTGLANQSFQELSIYPNPANNILKLDGLPVGSQIKLLDVLGRDYLSVTAMDSNGVIEINVSLLPEQLYLVQITSGEHSYASKVLIGR